MNLLVRVLLGLRQRSAAGLGVTLLAVASLVAVEVLGRRSTSDLHDMLALAALLPILALVVARHKRSPLPGIDALARFARATLVAAKATTFQMGLDFRGTPLVRRGVPPVIRASIAIVAVASVAALTFSARLPVGARSAIMTVSYVAYLSFLVMLWLSMGLAILLVAFVSVAIIHDASVQRHRAGQRSSRRGVGIAVLIWFATILLMGILIPVRFAPLTCCVLGAIYLLGAIPARRFVVQFLWRPHQSIQVRAMSWGLWVTCQFMLIGLGGITLMLVACGALIHGDETVHTVMPLTCLLGVFLGWLGPGLLVLLCLLTALSRRRDPSRSAPPVAHVTLHAGASSRRAVRRLFSSRGWSVRFAPAAPDPLDVRMELVAERLPLERPMQQWPLVVTEADLSRGGMFVRLLRRDELQKRRRFWSGLESLLKHVKRARHKGSGYWLSPQFWFVAGLMRDARPGDDEPDLELGESPILSACVGPPYYRIFPRAVRKHLYDVLRGTQVDLIFFEDGISFKKLRRALRVLFEVYDVHAGRRPAEEIDFRGLRGLRVMIHDFQFDEPFHADGYPEPKYEMLGRARILHVFRDRGGEKERVEPPFDYDRRPAPVAAL